MDSSPVLKNSIRAVVIVLVSVLAFLLIARNQQVSKSPAGHPVAQLNIGTGNLTVEVVRTPEAMAQGLMFRKELPANTGMLFVFPEPQPVGFWMKNTYVPLTVAYLDAEGKILELHDLESLNETMVPSQSSQVAYAIEAPRGWFEKNGATAGSLVTPLDISWKAFK